jgi:hypothetical protein
MSITTAAQDIAVLTALNRNSPDSRNFAASPAPFSGFGNGKSPSPREKGD